MYNFRKGQIIYFDDPFAAVLSADKIDTYCSCCFARIPRSALVLPCLQCGKLVYCGAQCQLQDVNFHGIECEVLQNCDGTPAEQFRLTIRVLARGLTERATENFTTNNFFEHQRTINDLQTHYDDANEDTIERYRAKAAAIKEKLDGVQFDVPVDSILEMMLKIRCNCHDVYDSGAPIRTKVGCALYLGASKMDHTCEVIDNYVQSFNGPNIVLTALRDFSVENSLDMRTHYVPPNYPVGRRRKELSNRYYFLCDCTRCLLEAATDEPNLPENLETFAELAPGEAWSEVAIEYYRRVQVFPPRNYYHFTLTSKLQLSCSRREDFASSVRYGRMALKGCMTFEDKKQVLYMLCHDMAKLGYNNPTNPGFEEFIKLRSDAMQLLSLVFESGHSLVSALKHLRYRPPPSPSPSRPAPRPSAPTSE